MHAAPYTHTRNYSHRDIKWKSLKCDYVLRRLSHVSCPLWRRGAHIFVLDPLMETQGYHLETLMHGLKWALGDSDLEDKDKNIAEMFRVRV